MRYFALSMHTLGGPAGDQTRRTNAARTTPEWRCSNSEKPAVAKGSLIRSRVAVC